MFEGAGIFDKKLILWRRETDYISDTDTRDHLTVMCFNSKGEGTTRHVSVSK
jgi:hypothetical protein